MKLREASRQFFLRKLGATRALPKKPMMGMDGPFDVSDLPPLPKEFTPKPPDFVGVGAPKSGTSWWYSLLIKHPHVYPHRLYLEDDPQNTKELNFFDHFGWQSPEKNFRDAYRSAFATPGQGICGEWSVYYLNQPLALYHLHFVVPETKILVLLRNPVDRTISHMNHVVMNRGRTLRLNGTWLDFFRTYSVSPEAFLHSLYSDAIGRIYKLFGEDQVLVLQYECCIENPIRELRKTFDFLSVESSFLPNHITKPINKLDYIIDMPSKSERKLIARYFEDDVLDLAGLCPDLDVRLWSDFD